MRYSTALYILVTFYRISIYCWQSNNVDWHVTVFWLIFQLHSVWLPSRDWSHSSDIWQSCIRPACGRPLFNSPSTDSGFVGWRRLECVETPKNGSRCPHLNFRLPVYLLANFLGIWNKTFEVSINKTRTNSESNLRFV